LRPQEEQFPKTARLTKRSEFLDLFRKGRKVHTTHFVFFSKARGSGDSRLGVTVSTKVGNAVVRNRIKRLLREFFRQRRHTLVSSRDIVIVAKKDAGNLSWLQVCQELEAIFTDRGAYRK
jgi:ribonuclease P protein component